MQDTPSIPQQISTSKSEPFVAAILGIVLAALPTWLIARNHSLEMAIGLGMVMVPLLGLGGWASGSAKALVVGLGGILRVFMVATVGNATNSTLARKLLLPEAELDWDETRRQALAVQDRIQTAETIEELKSVISLLERRRRFVYRRRVVAVIAAIAALAVTTLCMLDWMSLRKNGQAVILPSNFKDTEFENLGLIVPVVFVLFAVPLAVCFANYSKRYFVGCLVLSAYVGLAFYFIFHANLPTLQIWVPPIIVYLVTSGVGLLADWVSLDEVATVDTSDAERTKSANDNSRPSE